MLRRMLQVHFFSLGGSAARHVPGQCAARRGWGMPGELASPPAQPQAWQRADRCGAGWLFSKPLYLRLLVRLVPGVRSLLLLIICNFWKPDGSLHALQVSMGMGASDTRTASAENAELRRLRLKLDCLLPPLLLSDFTSLVHVQGESAVSLGNRRG